MGAAGAGLIVFDALTSSAVGGVFGISLIGGTEPLVGVFGVARDGGRGIPAALLVVWDPGSMVSSGFLPSA
jgi:hypothetical protein